MQNAITLATTLAVRNKLSISDTPFTIFYHCHVFYRIHETSVVTKLRAATKAILVRQVLVERKEVYLYAGISER